MLKFFRRIRQNLLSEGKTGKYLKYAIGEIVLVVLGILIALQVNTWNENRKTISKASQLKKGLYSDLLIAKKTTEYDIKSVNEQVLFYQELLENWEEINYEKVLASSKSHWAIKELSLNFYLFSYSQFFDLKNDIYKAMISEGSNAILTDSQKFLSELDEIYNFSTQRINQLIEREYELSHEINAHLSNHYATIFLENNYGHLDWTKEAYDAFFLKARLDGVLKYKLSQRQILMKTRVMLMQGALNDIDEAIELGKNTKSE